MYKIYKNIPNEPNIIFVFGSNTDGYHDKLVLEKFGAIYGKYEGLQGNSYAIPMIELHKSYQEQRLGKSLPVERIVLYIKRLYKTCLLNPDLKFYISFNDKLNNKTLCEYTGEQVLTFFKAAKEKFDYPDNIYFSEEWVNSGLL